jgi:hypothetical protein
VARLKVQQDDDATFPRDWENLCTIVYAHPTYTIGDIAGSSNSVPAEKELACRVPVYLLDHSGLSVSTTPFNCPWDSGQVGEAYVTKAQARNWLGVKRLTAKSINKVKEIIEGEVATLDQYFSGRVYSYELFNDNNELIDECSDVYELEGMLDCEYHHLIESALAKL